MADKPHELPGGFGVALILFAERRHAAQADSVVDGVEKFAVGLVLSFCRAHVRRLWVHVSAEAGIAAAVVGVAEKAVIGKVLHAVTNVFRRIGNGVLQAAVGSGNRESPRLSDDQHFHLRGSFAGAEASLDHTPGEERSNENQNQNCSSYFFPRFHVRCSPPKQVMKRAWSGDRRASSGYEESSIGRSPASIPAFHFRWNRQPCLQNVPLTRYCRVTSARPELAVTRRSENDSCSPPSRISGFK